MTTSTMHDHYAQEPGGFRLRGGVGLAVVLVHISAIGWLFMPSSGPEPAEAGAMQMVFIAPPQPEESSPPPPQPKVEQPPILAAKRQAESAPEAPVVPPEPVPDAPIVEQVSEVPAHPAPPPSAIVSSTSSVAVNDAAVAVIYVPIRRNKFVLPAGVDSVTVKLRVLVNAKGRPESISVLVSSGNPSADRRAMQDVRDYRFRPATVAGIPISKEATIPIKFEAGK
ncbi:MAG: energy transducer TonB family protein [Moraxellaceae bacterium]